MAATLVFAAAPWPWFTVRDLHPVLDTVAIGLPVIVASALSLCVLVALVGPRRPAAVVAASWLAFGLVAVVGPWVPQPTASPERGLRVVAANTFGFRSEADVVSAALAAAVADVTVVSELSDDLAATLSAGHRTTVTSVGSDNGEVGLFTDLPATDLGLPPGLADQRGVRVQVEAPAGAVVVYGLHLERPTLGRSNGSQVSVRRHAQIVATLRDAVATESLPVVVAGDLNLVDRTTGYRALTAVLDDAMLAGWGRPTALRRLSLPLLTRIDHVFMPSGWCSAEPSVFDIAGSDHRGVAATVGPCP